MGAVAGRRHRVQVVAVDGVLPARPRAEQIHRAVHRDAVHPGAEAGARFEAIELPVGLQKRLLDHVFGVLTAAGHAVGEIEDTSAVTLDEQAERLAVAAASECHGDAVVFRHLAGLDGGPERLVSARIELGQPERSERLMAQRPESCPLA